MVVNKTKPEKLSVNSFITNYPNKSILKDCETLIKFFTKVTGFSPVIWSKMIGFGTYHYKYASGHECDYFLTGFAPSKTGITIYTNCDQSLNAGLLNKLGTHKVSKSCLYVKKLSDINLDVLEKIINKSLEYTKQQYS